MRILATLVATSRRFASTVFVALFAGVALQPALAKTFPAPGDLPMSRAEQLKDIDTIAENALSMGLGSAARGENAGALHQLDRYLDWAQSKGDFNGVVLVGVGDRVVMDRAYGFADFESRLPLRPGHIFRIGSLTKPVTASVVLRAASENRLSLVDKACPHIANCPQSWKDVTVAQLLSHRSGIKDHFGNLDAVPVGDTVAELNRVLGTLDRNEPLETAPGQTYKYSNFNYVLLGAVLEDVYKQPWRDLIRQKAAGPSQAVTLDYDDVYAIVPSRIRGYDRAQDRSVRNIEYKDHAAYAAGGLRSSIGDFFKWSRASLGGKLFSPEFRDRMIRPEVGTYGFGWQVAPLHGRAAYNHTGGVDGFSTHIIHYPASALTIVVFSNIESDSAMLVACDAAAILFNIPQARNFQVMTALTPAKRCGLN